MKCPREHRHVFCFNCGHRGVALSNCPPCSEPHWQYVEMEFAHESRVEAEAVAQPPGIAQQDRRNGAPERRSRQFPSTKRRECTSLRQGRREPTQERRNRRMSSADRWKEENLAPATRHCRPDYSVRHDRRAPSVDREQRDRRTLTRSSRHKRTPSNVIGERVRGIDKAEPQLHRRNAVHMREHPIAVNK